MEEKREEMMASNVTPMSRSTNMLAWYNRINLSSVIAGTFIALASWLVLILLGYAIGFGTSTVNSVATLRSVGTGVGVWVSISGLIAFFIGGYFTSRFADIPRASDGLWHGIATWAFATVIGLPFVALVFTGLFAFVNNWISVALGIPSGAAVSPTSIQNAANVTALIASFIVIGALLNLAGSALGGWLGSRRMSAAEAMRMSERERMVA